MKVAITGGIGSGKSVVIEELKFKLKDTNYKFFSIDEKVAELYENIFIRSRLLIELGTDNKTELSKKVFVDKAIKDKLENFFSPYLIETLKEWLKDPNVIIEFPLLFESNLDHLFELTINIEASKELRLKRVLTRSINVTAKQIKSIMNYQLSNEDRRELAHLTIKNISSNFDDLEEHIINPIIAKLDIKPKLLKTSHVIQKASPIKPIIPEKIGIIAGSFDPITKGHLWVTKNAVKLVDTLYVMIAQNGAKSCCMFTAEERKQQVMDALDEYMSPRDLNKLKVNILEVHIPLATFADQIGASYIFRGIKNSTDFDYENQLNLVQRKISPSLETLYLIPPRELTEVSSSLIRQLIQLQGWESLVGDYICMATKKSIRLNLEKKNHG